MISAIISHKDNLRQDELKHHGILGQKWGVRRYQNADGSYTTEGRERYGIGNKEGGLFRKNEREEQMKRNTKNYHKFYKQPYDKRDYSYRNLAQVAGLGQDYINKMQDYKSEIDNIDNQTKQDFKGYLDEIGIWKASVGAYYAQSSIDKNTVEDLAREIEFCVLEDGDEGLSIALYAKENGLTKRCKESAEKIDSIPKEAAQFTVDEINRNVRVNQKEDLSKTIYWHVYDEIRELHNKNHTLYNDDTMSLIAEGSSKWYAEQIEKENIKSSKIRKIPDLIIKANPSKMNDGGFWSKMTIAIDKLGYNNMQSSDLTDAQWEEIGQMMNKLSN